MSFRVLVLSVYELFNNPNKCADAFAVFAGPDFCPLKGIEDETV